MAKTAPKGIRKIRKTSTPNPRAGDLSALRMANRCLRTSPRRSMASVVSSTVRKNPDTAAPSTGTTVCPTTGTNPRANRGTVNISTYASVTRLSRMERRKDRHIGTPPTARTPPMLSSTRSESFS